MTASALAGSVTSSAPGVPVMVPAYDEGIDSMAGNTVTRADLCEAVYQKVGLSRTESSELVERVLQEITFCLEQG